MASNFTLHGLERKGIEDVNAVRDPDLTVDKVLFPETTSAEVEAGEVIINNEIFSYDETHKVLKDGRVVVIDPLTNKWSRRPAGVAKELWDRLPHLRTQLQMMGPKLFTVEELRGVGDLPCLPIIPTGANSSGTNQGLDGNDIYDDGPLVSDDDGNSMVVNPSSSSTLLLADLR